MTGVSPVTMDDLTSGFNIAANISQDKAFNAMLGFTAEETLAIYRDFKGVGEYREGDPEAIVEPENFRSLFHYYGVLSMAERRKGMTYFRIPNACVERQLFNYLRDSYIVELKYSKPTATDAEVAAQAEEGIAQLRRYAADPTVPALSAGTRLHCILYQFKGTELIRLEELPTCF